MKRKLIIIVVLLLAALFAVFGWWKHVHPVRQSALNEFNTYSDLPYRLATPEAQLGDMSDFEECPGYGCYLLENQDIIIWISGYPDVLDDGHVTQYDVKSDKYSILGLRVGDDVGEVDTTLRKFGYDCDTHLGVYTKGGIRIETSLIGIYVSGFSVSLYQTNRQKILF